MSQNPADGASQVRPMLSPGEQLLAVIPTQNRTISVSNRRVFLNENSGGFSAIRNASVEAVEVSGGKGTEKLVKFYFGGMSRTVSVPDDAALAALMAGLGSV